MVKVHIETCDLTDTKPNNPAKTQVKINNKKHDFPNNVLNLLLRCMSFAGVLHVNVKPPMRDKTSSCSKMCSTSRKCALVWSWLGFAVCWINVFRLSSSLTKITKFGEESFITVVVIVWYLQCAISASICMRITFNSTLFKRLLELWEKNSKERPMYNNQTKLKRIVYGFVASYVAFVTANVVLISYVMFSDDVNLQYIRQVLYSPFHNDFEKCGDTELTGPFVFKILLLFLQAFFAGTWILSLWLFALVCLLNKCFLEDTSLALSEQVHPATRRFNGDLEAVRLRHETACDMVRCADDLFSLFVALGLGTDIPLACFVLYMMIWPATQSSYMVIFNVFLLVMDAFHLSVIMWTASIVNVQVK